jgi:hypothetical protein
MMEYRVIKSGLKMQTKQAFFVDSNDLNDFVNSVYGLTRPKFGESGIHFHFESGMEAHNDTAHVFELSGTDYDVGDVETWLNIGKNYMGDWRTPVRDILEDLVAKGKMPQGTYVIVVSW